LQIEGTKDTSLDIFIAGTGSFAAEIADWAQAAGRRVAGLVELFDDSDTGTIKHAALRGRH
jgi:hypothetical protein